VHTVYSDIATQSIIWFACLEADQNPPRSPFTKLSMSHKFLLDTGGASVLAYLHAGLRSTFYGRCDR
jgi:hypothetical protein